MSGEPDKSWMFESDIFGKVYRDGVKFFIQYASANGFWKTNCACPCAKCENRRRLGIGIVEQHLYENGIDQTYVTWVLHGEKQPVHIAMSNPVENVANEQVREDVLADLKSSDQWVVIHSPKRLTATVDDLEKPITGNFQDLFTDEPHLARLMVQRR